MRRLIGLVGLLGLAAACTPPQTAPSNLNISNVNTNNNGQGQTPDSCQTADTVNIQAATAITHGTPMAVSLIPVLAGQVVQNPCGPVVWVVQAPCFVANAGAISTTLDASAAGKCTVQGTVGVVSSPSITVTVN